VTWEIRQGDVIERLRYMPAESVQCVVTSPPYWGLRDYGTPGQLGLQRTPEEYVAKMVEVFREVRRVLRRDGTLWLNLGDSYAQNGGPGWQGKTIQRANRRFTAVRDTVALRDHGRNAAHGLKPKDLVGIPWRIAFALQADGWWLRSDIIWAKPNPMPESVTDRPTKAHEYLFLLAKSASYYFDQEAVKENGKPDMGPPMAGFATEGEHTAVAWNRPAGKHSATDPQASGRRITKNVARRRAEGGPHDAPFGPKRNIRSVWTIPTQPFPEAHFATFPVKLVEPCIKAGSRPGDLILDPFAGSGTVGVVALRLTRSFLGIELKSEYCEMARRRITDDAPLLNTEVR